MKKIADKDAAQNARDAYDALVFLRGSALGGRIDALLEKIKTDAYKKAMGGKTPQDMNAYFETRGNIHVVDEIQRLYQEIEDENQAALDYLAQLNALPKEEA